MTVAHHADDELLRSGGLGTRRVGRRDDDIGQFSQKLFLLRRSVNAVAKVGFLAKNTGHDWPGKGHATHQHTYPLHSGSTIHFHFLGF